MSKTKSNADDLVSKLATSSAMISLEMERNIAKQLKSLGWSTLHSCYYTDPIEGKTREIDVVGKQLWRAINRRYLVEKQSVMQTVILHLVIECKTAKGYHLLFAPDDETPVKGEMPNFEWAGDESYRKPIARRLGGIGLGTNQITTLMNKFDKIAYPNQHMCIFDLRIDPIKPPLRASAFRETKIDNEKDLDSSVLWKAGLTLNSAVASFKKRGHEVSIDRITDTAESVKKEGEDNVALAALLEFTEEVNRIDIYHPIVVIDSMLWSTTTPEPKRIYWCRLEQRSETGLRNWWFDVVHYEGIADYLTKLTKHYASRLTRARAKIHKGAFSREYI